ncbi:MAG: ZIP family metal transporter [Candidatus Woesearchaeota archaeon]
MTFANVLLLSLIAGLATVLGVFLVKSNEKFTKKYSIVFISLAVGVLLGASFFELIPQSLELLDSALIFILIGFLIFYLLENLIVVHICKESDCKKHRIGTMAIIGIGFHSLIDGIIIAVGFEVSFALGIAAAIAVIAHEFPEGIITYSTLIHAKFSKNKSFLYSILVAIATPIGAILAFPFIKNLTEPFLGGLLAIAAGTFLYIASSDLIPETHEKFSKLNALSVIIGVLILFFIERFIG